MHKTWGEKKEHDEKMDEEHTSEEECHRKTQEVSKKKFSRVSKKLQITDDLLKTNYQKSIQNSDNSEITEDENWARKLRNKMKEKLEIITDMNAPLKAIRIRIYTHENKVMWVRIGK